MSRPIILSNNRMLVGLNQYGLVHDFYYPYVGLENHASAKYMRHKIGVWVDGRFSWLDDGSWQIELDYQDNTLIGYTRATNDKLGILLEFHDFIAISENALMRNLHIINNSDKEREVRVFFHQVLQISESTRGDTALYVPDEQLILDYKGRRAFVVYAENHQGQPFDEYSIGNYGIEGKEGTFKDAEDGKLEGNDVEHGQVDTVLRLSNMIEPHGSARNNYWLIAAMTNSDALELHQRIRKNGLKYYLTEATDHWTKWLRKASRKASSFGDNDKKAFLKSTLLVKSHADTRGAMIASCDSQMLNYARDYYSYCWPRDSAYNLLPLIDMGYREEAKAFFEFSRDVLHEKGYLLHKYLSDRSVGSSWHPALHRHHSELPIQEDETAIVLYAIHRYLKSAKDKDFVMNLYHTLIQPAARFLANFIDDETRLPHASYDLWEEKFLTSTYSVAVVYAALNAASQMAEEFEFADDAIAWGLVADDMQQKAKEFLVTDEGYLRKGYYLTEDKKFENDETLDISTLYGVIEFDLLDRDDEAVVKTLEMIEKQLLDQAPVGGIARYEYDYYNSPQAAYKGNPWLVSTLWLAQIYLAYGRDKDARRLVNWALDRQKTSGVLPEQINPETGEYLSVAPLIWSQAELLRTLKRLYKLN